MSFQLIDIIDERFLSGGEITNEFIEECNTQLQQELFALPFSTYEVANLDGWKLYSSDSLKRKFCESMEKMSKTNPISDGIRKLVYKNTIVPCWINKGIFRLLLFKVFASKGSKGTLGFYTPKEDQIYLLIDNNISFGFASNYKLAVLTVHESMHMAATHMKSGYVTLFSREIVAYYAAMIKQIFKITDNIDKEASVLMKFLFAKFEFRSVSSAYVKTFTKMYSILLVKLFRNKSKLGVEEFDKNVMDYTEFIRLYFRDINQFIQSLRKYPNITRGLKVGYENGLKVRNDISLCIQELFFPSEIIAIYSELCSKGQMSKIYRAFHSI